MAVIKSLKRQHKDIEGIMNSIEEDMYKKPIEEYVSGIVQNIGYLSGILTMHLKKEDEFIYPNLTKVSDQVASDILNHYLKEMKDISALFIRYKTQFNTSRKIINALDIFMNETITLFNTLRRRMEREDVELYKFLENLEDTQLIKIALLKKEDSAIKQFPI